MSWCVWPLPTVASCHFWKQQTSWRKDRMSWLHTDTECEERVRILFRQNLQYFCSIVLVRPGVFGQYQLLPQVLKATNGCFLSSARGLSEWKKREKNWPPPKLIFCHKLSPLDWIMVIWAIFGLPGPSGGSGGPMWGLGGPAGTKFTNFHMGQFLALRCCFLDLTSF